MAEQEPAAPEEAAPEADAPEEDGGISFALILLPVILIMIAVGGWLAYSQYDQIDETADQMKTYFTSSDTASAPTEYGSFYEIKGLIINPASTEGARYLMVNVGLESSEQSVISDLESKEIVVRDRIIRLLSERTSEELGDIALRDSIKRELRSSINEVLEGGVDRLYFTQYVLQ